MLEYATNALMEVASRPAGLGFALLLGVVSAAASGCCTLPALGLLIGYSGAKGAENRSTALKQTLCFTLGIIAALMALGGIVGLAGQAAQNALGQYWKVFAGVAAVALGLAALDLLPFKLSLGRFERMKERLGASKTVLAGFALGGIIAASSLCCNPGIFIVIGAAMIQGQTLWAALLLGMYAVGFSLPLGVVLFGVSMGKTRFAVKGSDTVVRWIAGGLLLIAGFSFLLTL